MTWRKNTVITIKCQGRRRLSLASSGRQKRDQCLKSKVEFPWRGKSQNIAEHLGSVALVQQVARWLFIQAVVAIFASLM